MCAPLFELRFEFSLETEYLHLNMLTYLALSIPAQVEVGSRREVARLDALLAQSARAQQQIIASQSAAHGRIATELQAIKEELVHARGSRARLESVIEQQRDDMQRECTREAPTVVTCGTQKVESVNACLVDIDHCLSTPPSPLPFFSTRFNHCTLVVFHFYLLSLLVV